MKKITLITLLFIFSTSCDSRKSKIIGIWKISEFTINNKSLKDPSLNYSDPTDPIRIQFLENGFFILTSNHTDLLLKYLHNDSQAHMYEITSKGKWSVNLFSKIELQFIDTHHELGLLKGDFSLSDGSLIIDAKGDNDFIYFALRQ
jgi:hypothetical protein